MESLTNSTVSGVTFMSTSLKKASKSLSVEKFLSSVVNKPDDEKLKISSALTSKFFSNVVKL